MSPDLMIKPGAGDVIVMETGTPHSTKAVHGAGERGKYLAAISI